MIKWGSELYYRFYWEAHACNQKPEEEIKEESEHG